MVDSVAIESVVREHLFELELTLGSVSTNAFSPLLSFMGI